MGGQWIMAHLDFSSITKKKGKFGKAGVIRPVFGHPKSKLRSRPTFNFPFNLFLKVKIENFDTNLELGKFGFGVSKNWPKATRRRKNLERKIGPK